MSDQLYNKYADIPALEQDTAKILAMFDQVEKGAIKLSSFGIKIGTANSTRDVEKLASEYEGLTSVIEKQKKEITALAIKLSGLTGEEAKQAEALRQTIGLVKGLTAEEIKRQKLQQGEYAALQQAKQANNELNKSIQLRIKLAAAEEGSITQLDLKYQKLYGIVKNLSEAQRGTSRGQGLVKQAEDLKNKLNELKKGAGDFSSNVGRYAESLGGLFDKVGDEIAKLKSRQAELQNQQRTQIGGFQIGGGQQKELDQVTASIEKLNGVQQIGFKTGQSYYTTVKQVEKAYGDLANTPGISGEFLEEFRKHAAEAKDSAADLKDEIKALSSDTRQLDLAVGTISVMASAFEAGAGAAALFGGNTEDIARVTQKLVAIQSVANGVREVGEQITKRGTAANIAYNFVLKQTSILFGTGVTAANRFSAAMKLTGIGLAITALTFIISKLNIFGDESKDAQKKTDELNKSLEYQAELITNIGNAYQKTGEIRRERLKQQGADDKTLFQDELDQKKREAAELQDIANKATVDQVKYDTEKRKTLTELYEKFGKKNISISKKQREEMAKQDQINNDKVEQAAKAAAAKEEEITLFKEQYKTKVYQDGVEKRKDADKKAAENAKQYAESEKRAALELFKFRQGLIAEEGNLRSGDDAPYSAKFKIEAAQQAFDAQKKILQAQQAYDLSLEKVTASQRILINEKYADDLYKLELDLGQKITQIYVNETQRRKAEIDESIASFEQDQADAAAKSADSRQKAFEKEQSQIATMRDNDLTNNAENFKKGLITQEQYDLRKAEIETSYQKTILESQLRFYEAQLKLLQDSGEDTTKALETIANLKAQISGINADDIAKAKAVEQERLDALDALQAKYKELGATVEDTFKSVVAGVYDAQKNRIQDQIDDIDRLKEAEIDRINESGLSEEKKAAKVKLIESKAAADKEKLERRKRQIDLQKAAFDRGTKVFDLVTDNVVAINKIKVAAAAAANPVIKALLLAQIPITIATGAASLVALLATPLPKYQDGTESSVGGAAEVAEDGRELAVEPSGRMRMFTKRGIARLVKGTRIYKNRVTEDIMAAAANDIAHPMLVKAIGGNDIDMSPVISELKELNKKNINIYNAPGIETTEYYQQQMKN